MNNTLTSIAKAIGTIAPTLATMLGGPFAGVAVTALETAFGLKPGAGADSVTQVLQSGAMTPEIAANVRAADQHHAEVMAQQGIDLAKLNAAHSEAYASLDVEDRASARAREMAVKDSAPRRLAYMIIGGFFVVSLAQLVAFIGYADVVAKIPSQGWLMIGNISGYLANEAKQATAYYFGSTAGSQAKDATLADLAKGAST